MLNYKTIFEDIEKSCLSGKSQDIDHVMTILTRSADLPTTKAVDFYLGQVNHPEGINRIKFYLFNGSLIQRNYCTLYFARKNKWETVNEAFRRGLVDWKQAYSR